MMDTLVSIPLQFLGDGLMLAAAVYVCLAAILAIGANAAMRTLR